MTEVDKLLEVAASQIGETEDPPGSNNIKYNTDYYGRQVSGDSYPWCMAFVWWCFKQAGLSRLFYSGRRTASCNTLMRWAKSNEQFVEGTYQKGDVIFYDWDSTPDADHTGIVESDNGTTVTVIEGNTSDRVARVRRSKSIVLGAWRPQFSDTPAYDSLKPSFVPELAKGSTGASVKALQILLEGYGFTVGRYGLDGDFGDDTQLALLRYQKKNGLEADGICGVNTWLKLLGVTQ